MMLKRIFVSLSLLILLSVQLVDSAPIERRDERSGMINHPTGNELIDKIIEFFLPSIVSNTDEPSDVCAICLELIHNGQPLKSLPCGHTFHQMCVTNWFDSVSNSSLIDQEDIHTIN